MTVLNVWCGATTPTSALVVGKVEGQSVRLAVSESPAMTAPTYFGPVTPTSQGVVRLTATGLQHDSRYHFGLEVDNVLDTAFPGQFRTHPAVGQPASFAIGMATCAAGTGSSGIGDVLASNRLSNHPVFDWIRERALAEEWLLFIHGGDLHYYDIGSGVHVPNHDLATFRRAYDDVLRQPRQHALYRNVPTVYMYDDHDFGPNDSDSTSPGRDNSVQVYQERVPHYPRGAASPNDPNYQTFEIGRVLFVVWDTRADRDPKTDPQGPGKTMLGAGQKAWFDNVLASSNAELLVLVNPTQWDRSDFSDSWAGYVHERDEIVGILGAPGGDPAKSWLGRMCMLQGDHHALGMSSFNLWGGFPVFQFAPLDSGPGTTQSWRDIGSVPSLGSYGSLYIEDSGNDITVTAVGWANDQEVLQHSFIVGQSPARAVQMTQSAQYEAVNTTFGTAFVSGTHIDCGVVFTAPESGRVLIHWSGGVRNVAAGSAPVAYLSPEVREGPVVGAGNVVLAAANDHSLRTNLPGSATVRAGVCHVLVSGLAPGEQYNARILHRVTSQVGQFFQRSIIAEPVP